MMRSSTISSEGTVYLINSSSLDAEAKGQLLASASPRVQIYRHPLDLLKANSFARPCCAVFCITALNPDEMELIKRLRQWPTRVPVIVVAAYGEVKAAVQAIKLGAAEFLEEPVPGGLLVCLAKQWIAADREERAKLQESLEAQRKLATLTRRERDVLAGLLEGLSSKEIAANLKLSSKSIETYRGKLMAKMQARSTVCLVKEITSLQVSCKLNLWI